MDRARHDVNLIPTLTGVSLTDGETPVSIWADPVTHEILVKATGTIAVTTANYSTEIDTTSTVNTVYIGKQTIGAGTTADPTWQIKKIDNSVIDIQWADSDDNFDNIWDNRTILTYGI